MQRLFDREVLEQFAYESWLRRGRPIGSPEIDWEAAELRFSREQDTTVAADPIENSLAAKPRADNPKDELSLDL
ncbi:MAG: DUF2934 domain-containing protein [Steroidobacteraceae bacterium]